MEIKVGDYVRYVRGTINGYVPPRISKIQEIESEFYIKLDNNQVVMTNDAIKSSQDIIDLIEVGDYVNGEKVKSIIIIYNEEEQVIGKKLLTEYRIAQYTIEDINYYLYETDIKSIVTKEQFESMSYNIN